MARLVTRRSYHSPAKRLEKLRQCRDIIQRYEPKSARQLTIKFNILELIGRLIQAEQEPGEQ
jgi:hypothetical protein